MLKLKSSFIVSILLFGLNIQGFCNSSTEKKDFEISKNYEILHALYRELDQFYVDSVKPEKVLQNSINGLMSSFDPYTNYMPESETEDFKFITTGEYGGIGAIIGPQNGKVVVLDPYQNMPAQKAGLLAGDILLEINGVKMDHETINRASELLKGQPGTEVKLRIQREGLSKPFEKKILRELILVNQVTYHGLVDNKIGYINLSGFTSKASQEVRQALLDLKKQGAQKLVLDLRGNGGGLLDEAVSICNLFVNKGQEIVNTRGRVHQWDQTYKTTREPIDTVMPIVILANRGSASSSEIVCGAMQDLDRAVILGTRTFGKGLVQTTRNIPFNGVLKVTTAKYYIPSGRCIQAIDYSNRNEDGSVGRIPDSLTTEFTTRAGRKVKDGGGIQPDIECKDERVSSISYYLLDGMYFFDYANQYYRKHDKIAPVSEFKISDAVYLDFLEYVKGRKFTYDSQSKKAFDKLKEALDAESYTEDVKNELTALASKLNRNLDDDFVTFRKEIEMLLSAEIVSRYYYQSGEMQQSLKFDPCLKKAIEVLNNPEMYANTLKPTIVKD
ncbi:MAG: S41 family peptidase [Bacteroidales bacterium]|nr:S41 family peptidase [Bacteroidales bacterium]